MNRINLLFQNNPGNLLSIYFCAGCPTLEGTADVIRTLEKNGVNMIEIGIPFSDPMADGIVIKMLPPVPCATACPSVSFSNNYRIFVVMSASRCS